VKIWIKRLAALALVLAGTGLLIRHAVELLDWPHLYPDLGQAGKENLLFFGLTLLAVAFAWIAAAYLLLNAEKGILHQLIPAAAFILLLTLGGLCLTRAVGEIPCTYTTALSSCREEFNGQTLRVRGTSLYPEEPAGELTDYARYEKGEVLAETVTRTYDQDGFALEAARLRSLGLDAFQPEQDTRERPITCYEVRVGDTLWQVLVVPKTKTVTYSRFNYPDRLPSFAPQPTEQPPVPVYY
jgi:uncharacterized membrane protein YhdT